MVFHLNAQIFRVIVATKKQNVLNAGKIGFNQKRNRSVDMTNAEKIRSMSDEELAEFLITFKNTFGEEYEGEASCMDWLQSEAE